MFRSVIRVLAALVLVAALAACGDDTTETTDTTAGPTTTADDESTTTEAPTTTEDAAELVDVAVYFARGEALATGGRSVEPPAVAREAMEALLAGPNDLEVELGMFTVIPEGTELLDIDVADGLAIVDLTGEFETGGGSLSVIARVAQVVYTLTQFDTVDTVDIRIDGVAVEAISGEGLIATGLTRDDFRDVTPLILVESPTPGAEVGPTMTVTGTSNTFEATVQWLVTDWDGLIVLEGFTTATAGTGTWGTFAFDVDLSELDPLYDRITLIVFEESAEDGMPRLEYEVPLTLVTG